MALKGVKAAGELSYVRENALWGVFWPVYMFVYGACEAGFSRRMGCGLMRCELKGER